MTHRARASLSQQVSDTTSLPNAHAHADSRHRRPLWDALSAGFTSIEVDVWVLRGQVFVGHSVPHPLRTLRRSYLDPLAAMIWETGCVYNDFDRPIQLLLDVKSDAKRSRPAIEATLARRTVAERPATTSGRPCWTRASTTSTPDDLSGARDFLLARAG